MAPLYKSGWKFSGGNIATHSGFDSLWHATVFRANDGPFFNGFHLTMNYHRGPEEKIQPHVFFLADGTYDQGATEGHKQTAGYIKDVGRKQWDFDLDTAKVLAQSVRVKLGPILSVEECQEILQVAQEKREKAEKEVEDSATRKEAEEALRQAAVASAGEERLHIQELLSDVHFHGSYYLKQFMAYIDGQSDAITDLKLLAVAQWYVDGRKQGWIIREDPQAAFTGWARTPKKVEWPEYSNCLSKTWRQKNPKTTFMSEFRMLKFNGYASYKQHPMAGKPPKT